MKSLSVASLLSCNPGRLVGALKGLFLSIGGSVQLINICVSSPYLWKSGRLLYPVGSVLTDCKILIGFTSGAC